MKKSIHSLIASSLLSGVIALGIVASPVCAQAQSSQMAEAKIPFAFQVGKTVMPAGNYVFIQQSQSILTLRKSDATASASVVVLQDMKRGHVGTGSVAFTRYGDRYFFRNIALPNSSYGYRCLKGNHEKEVSRDWLSQKPEEVAINTGAPRIR